MVSTHCHLIVIGAGIGGLTAALSLQRHGFKVSVYEQASELREFGAGLAAMRAAAPNSWCSRPRQ
jgi:2-polyprenyl-6-methoxyphenol hydroxylase-like FAD-dependent oxidoreductase